MGSRGWCSERDCSSEMGRKPKCSEDGVNRGAWTGLEDKLLISYIKIHGEAKWRSLPKRAGLKRCGMSCRLRWMNYLRPDIKRGNITHDEEQHIIKTPQVTRWSLIAGHLPGRTDNEIKNYWKTKLSKRLNAQSPRSTTKTPTSNSKENMPELAPQPPDSEAPPPSSKIQTDVIRTKDLRFTKEVVTPQEDMFPSLHRNIEDIGPHQTNRPDKCFDPSVMDLNLGELYIPCPLNSNFSPVCKKQIQVQHEMVGKESNDKNDLSLMVDHPSFLNATLLDNLMNSDFLLTDIIGSSSEYVSSFLDLE